MALGDTGIGLAFTKDLGLRFARAIVVTVAVAGFLVCILCSAACTDLLSLILKSLYNTLPPSGTR